MNSTKTSGKNINNINFHFVSSYLIIIRVILEKQADSYQTLCVLKCCNWDKEEGFATMLMIIKNSLRLKYAFLY